MLIFYDTTTITPRESHPFSSKIIPSIDRLPSLDSFSQLSPRNRGNKQLIQSWRIKIIIWIKTIIIKPRKEKFKPDTRNSTILIMFDHSITRIALLITITRIRPWNRFEITLHQLTDIKQSSLSFLSILQTVRSKMARRFGEGDKEHNNGNSCATTYLGRVSRRVSFSFSKWSKVFAESRFPRDELWALAPDDEHPFRLFLSLVVSRCETRSAS